MNYLTNHYKQILAMIASSMVIISYIPYIKDIFKNKTKPHIYSWILWGVMGCVITAIQFTKGAGFATLVTLSANLISLFIITISIKRNGFDNITKSDTILFIAALIAIIFWPFTKNPTFSITLLTIIALTAMIPTIRKSWTKPYQETLFSWFLNGMRFTIAIFALQNFNYNTALYPITWALTNFCFACFLVIRRKQLSK